jgi:endonuclease VIII-like 3
MVEGPGCKLKGEKMRGKIIGQTVKAISGNAIENRPKRDKDKPTPFHSILGKKVIDVKTLGKELFIFFCSGHCLRVHFLMAGFVRYNGASEDPDEGAKKKLVENPRLQLNLDKDVVSLYQCSTEIRDSEQTEKRWNNNIELDICWKQFNHERATQEILNVRNSERLICDVILDQEILPGVGNIIKNEALFDAGINPLSKVKDLTQSHVSRLVKMNRDFSMIFYDCRKNGKPLHKFYKMYRFSKCKQCEGRVTKCKPGEYERGTYFCAVCQDNSMKAGPSKNSLIGWTSGVIKTWTCTACTFENKPGSVSCFTCGTIKTAKRKSSDSGLTSTQHKPKVARTESGRSSTVLADRNELNSNEKEKDGHKEMCKGHKKACTVKTVSKAGENKGRLFNTCSMPRGKSCDHFSWADLHHPKCKHNSVTFKREVYKQNENNGRAFYVCPQPKAKQCDFFMWADTQ